LHDAGVLGRIAAAVAAAPGDHLVEIGPGEGALSRRLLESGARLDAIEIDRDLAAGLAGLAAGNPRLRVQVGDALQFDFCALAERAGETLRVVGNLPYNISSPLLFHLLEQLHCIRDMCFMLQKEVVDRICAAPGSSDYGRLSVMLQARCAPTALFRVRPGAFRPAPKVDSAVFRLQPHSAALDAAAPQRFAHIVRAAFGQRRKALRNSLKGLVDAAGFASAGVDPGLRAGVLAVSAYARLSETPAPQ
jgi:16S rRNA (adenine1518-N6/adenine1519-N6)-dimethyltransferase